MQRDFAAMRAAMVERQIAARGVRDPLVLAAMRDVPREAFVAPDIQHRAYDDSPQPIGAGQTISQPYIVAVMIAAAGVKPGERVLEVGAGSGYAAALLGRIAGHVFAIERHAELAEAAAIRLAGLGYDNVTLRTGDGSAGWADAAPFDAILVSAAAPQVPDPLVEQLASGGRLVLPAGDAGAQRLMRVVKRADGSVAQQPLEEVRFVPLIGAHGWRG